VLEERCPAVAIRGWSPAGVRQRLFETGGRLIRQARRSSCSRLAENYLTGRLFRLIVVRIERLACGKGERTLHELTEGPV
jgi:hypothetical protein